VKAKPCVVLPAVLLAAVLAISGSSTCKAASNEIDELIRAIEMPKPPAERPDAISKAEWNARKEAAWAWYRAEASRRLTAEGKAAAGKLIALIKRTQDNSVKIMALTGLSLMENPADLKPAGGLAVDLLSDKNAGLRYLAAKILGVVRFAKAVPQLNALLAGKEDRVRIAAADALGRIRDVSSVPPLLLLVDYGKGDKDNDEKKAVRLHSVAALGEIGPALDVVPKLIEKLRSKDKNEREVAVEAIEALLGYDIRGTGRWLIAHTKAKREPIIKAFEDWWAKALKDRRFRIARKAELTLRVNMLAHQKWQPEGVRAKAALVLARMGDPKAVDYVIIAMSTSDKNVRKAVAKTAKKLTGIHIEYLDTDTEATWDSKVDTFRQKWGEIRGGTIRKWEEARRARSAGSGT
jgi:hypothetical protein